MEFDGVRRDTTAAVDGDRIAGRADQREQRQVQQPRFRNPQRHVHRGNGRRGNTRTPDVSHRALHRGVRARNIHDVGIGDGRDQDPCDHIHGGAIAIPKSDKSGTTFRVTLPALP